MPPSSDRLLTGFALCYRHIFHQIFDMLHLPDMTWLCLIAQKAVDSYLDIFLDERLII